MTETLLTLFTIPKAFEGHIGLIQRNAIATWLRLEPRCEIVLFGEEAGVAETASELGVRHVPSVERNQYGTPLVNNVFARVEEMASGGLLGYINTDILLLSDFATSVARMARLRRAFLLIGRRWDLDVSDRLCFGPNWEQGLRLRVAREGQLHAISGIDYFVYHRGLWPEIPPFAVGRTVWDQWLVDRARRNGAWVVDGTASICAVHQNHPYSSPEGKRGIWEGPEAKRNLELAGGNTDFLRLPDATHRLVRNRLQSTLLCPPYRRRIVVWSVLYPGWGWLARMALRLLDATYRVRSRLALSHLNSSARD